MSYAIRNDMKGCRAINHPDDIAADEHYSVSPLPSPEPSLEELIEAAINLRNGLLAAAATRIGPLQDAVEMGIATSDEVEALAQWRQYRIVLSRVDKREGFPREINWPVVPA